MRKLTRTRPLFVLWAVLWAVLGSAVAAAGGPEVSYDQVSLAVDVHREIENDLLVAVMFTEQEGERQAEVAARVNETMQWAMQQARKDAQLDIRTLQYSTSPVYHHDAISGWRARQALRLESRDAAALSEMLGVLQARLSVQSISYSISRAALAAVEDGLIADAIARFRQRAQRVAEEFGRDRYRLVQVNISPSGAGAVPGGYEVAMRMSEAKAAPPAIEAGVQTVTVTVSGTIELGAPR